MNTDELPKQLELYSNAITAFVVIQSLSFALTLGSNADFQRIIVTEKAVSIVILAHFFGTSLLAIFAICYLSRAIRRLREEHGALIRTVFIGKCVVVGIFAIIPIFVLLRFGVFSHTAPKQTIGIAALLLAGICKNSASPP